MPARPDVAIEEARLILSRVQPREVPLRGHAAQQKHPRLLSLARHVDDDFEEVDFAEIARRTLMFKIMGRTVSAEIMDSDQYHRAVAVIRYNGRDINRDMVAEGMAWAYRHYLSGPYASEYIDAEERARARHKGLWRDANPLPPWEFRHALKGGKRHRRH